MTDKEFTEFAIHRLSMLLDLKLCNNEPLTMAELDWLREYSERRKRDSKRD